MSHFPDGRRRPIAYRPCDAAEILGISPSHLQRMTKAGEIPYADLGGIKVYVDDVLREYMRGKTTYGSPRAHESTEE